MEIKYNIQGLLIYQTMAMYLLALATAILKCKRTAWALYFIGFLISVISLVYRGINVNHFPLQNLFEVFLFLGSLAFIISLLSVKLLKIPGIIADILLGLIILFPAGFVFSDNPQDLPPALQSVLFVPHILAYMLAYFILSKAAVAASKQLIRNDNCEFDAYKLVCLGFPLLTLGLILGSVWAKLAWGDYWSWDPKELWSLATWLVYVGYFHYRTGYPQNKKLNAGWIIAGFVFIVITLLWANLSRIFAGMHNYAM